MHCGLKLRPHVLPGSSAARIRSQGEAEKLPTPPTPLGPKIGALPLKREPIFVAGAG